MRHRPTVPTSPESTFLARLLDGRWTTAIELGWPDEARSGMVRRFADRTFDPPVRLAFDEAQLVAHLDRTAEVARGIWPEVADDRERAFRLFTHLLDTALRTDVEPGATIVLRGGDIVVRIAR